MGKLNVVSSRANLHKVQLGCHSTLCIFACALIINNVTDTDIAKDPILWPRGFCEAGSPASSSARKLD